MKQFHNRFVKSEDGAITVDWVVLVALIIGLSAALILAMRTGLDNFGGNVDQALSTATVSTGDNDNAGGITSAGTVNGE